MRQHQLRLTIMMLYLMLIIIALFCHHHGCALSSHEIKAQSPTPNPFLQPSSKPPTRLPTARPTRSFRPTMAPTRAPSSRLPTARPSMSFNPTFLPTRSPTVTPSRSFYPTKAPTQNPTADPTYSPQTLSCVVTIFESGSNIDIGSRYCDMQTNIFTNTIPIYVASIFNISDGIIRESSAVSLCNLTSLYTINEGAFRDAIVPVENVIMSNLPRLTLISDDTFRNNKINNLTIHKVPNLSRVGKRAFFQNKLEDVTFVNLPSLNSIGDHAFKSNNIKTVKFNEKGLSIIEKHAFRDNQLKSVRLPESVRDIGAYAFADNPLDECCYEGSRPFSIGFGVCGLDMCLKPCGGYIRKANTVGMGLLFGSFCLFLHLVLFGVIDEVHENPFVLYGFFAVIPFFCSLGFYFEGVKIVHRTSNTYPFKEEDYPDVHCVKESNTLVDDAPPSSPVYRLRNRRLSHYEEVCSEYRSDCRFLYQDSIDDKTYASIGCWDKTIVGPSLFFLLVLSPVVLYYINTLLCILAECMLELSLLLYPYNNGFNRGISIKNYNFSSRGRHLRLHIFLLAYELWIVFILISYYDDCVNDKSGKLLQAAGVIFELAISASVIGVVWVVSEGFMLRFATEKVNMKNDLVNNRRIDEENSKIGLIGEIRFDGNKVNNQIIGDKIDKTPVTYRSRYIKKTIGFTFDNKPSLSPRAVIKYLKMYRILCTTRLSNPFAFNHMETGHTGQLLCSCGHKGLESGQRFPLIGSYRHLDLLCTWDCCKSDWDTLTCDKRRVISMPDTDRRRCFNPVYGDEFVLFLTAVDVIQSGSRNFNEELCKLEILDELENFLCALMKTQDYERDGDSILLNIDDLKVAILSKICRLITCLFRSVDSGVDFQPLPKRFRCLDKAGVAYRRSMNLYDRARDLSEVVYGSEIEAEEVVEGRWLRYEVPGQGQLFLPIISEHGDVVYFLTLNATKNGLSKSTTPGFMRSEYIASIARNFMKQKSFLNPVTTKIIHENIGLATCFCEMIKYLCRTEGDSKLLGKAGTCEFILSIVEHQNQVCRNTSLLPSFIAEAFGACYKLALVRENRLSICSYKGLQWNGTTRRSMNFSDTLFPAVLKYKGVKSIVALVNLLSTVNITVAEKACCLLFSDISGRNDRDLINELDTPRVVMSLLKNQPPNSEEVKIVAIEALSDLLFDSTNVVKFRLDGAIELLMERALSPMKTTGPEYYRKQIEEEEILLTNVNIGLRPATIAKCLYHFSTEMASFDRLVELRIDRLMPRLLEVAAKMSVQEDDDVMFIMHIFAVLQRLLYVKTGTKAGNGNISADISAGGGSTGSSTSSSRGSPAIDKDSNSQRNDYSDNNNIDSTTAVIIEPWRLIDKVVACYSKIISHFSYQRLKNEKNIGELPLEAVSGAHLDLHSMATDFSCIIVALFGLCNESTLPVPVLQKEATDFLFLEAAYYVISAFVSCQGNGKNAPKIERQRVNLTQVCGIINKVYWKQIDKDIDATKKMKKITKTKKELAVVLKYIENGDRFCFNLDLCSALVYVLQELSNVGQLEAGIEIKAVLFSISAVAEHLQAHDDFEKKTVWDKGLSRCIDRKKIDGGSWIPIVLKCMTMSRIRLDRFIFERSLIAIRCFSSYYDFYRALFEGNDAKKDLEKIFDLYSKRQGPNFYIGSHMRVLWPTNNYIDLLPKTVVPLLLTAKDQSYPDEGAVLIEEGCRIILLYCSRYLDVFPTASLDYTKRKYPDLQKGNDIFLFNWDVGAKYRRGFSEEGICEFLAWALNICKENYDSCDTTRMLIQAIFELSAFSDGNNSYFLDSGTYELMQSLVSNQSQYMYIDFDDILFALCPNTNPFWYYYQFDHLTEFFLYKGVDPFYSKEIIVKEWLYSSYHNSIASIPSSNYGNYGAPIVVKEKASIYDVDVLSTFGFNRLKSIREIVNRSLLLAAIEILHHKFIFLNFEEVYEMLQCLLLEFLAPM